MSIDLRDALIEGVIESTRHESFRNHWAYGVMSSLVMDAPEIAWPILLEVIDRAPDEALGNIAAGPLEDLIGNHGFQIIDALEVEARQSPKLRRALVGVWQGLTVESIWSRVQALIDDDAKQHWERFEPRHAERRIEWQVPGMPPTAAGSIEPEQRKRREVLLAAFKDVTTADFRPWSTPVYVRVRIESGPAGDPSASAGDAASAIAETLAVDRGNKLVDSAYVAVGAVTTRALVREISAFDVFSREPSYSVALSKMSEEQVASISDPATFDEVLSNLAHGPDELRKRLAQEWIDSGLEITPEMREMFRNQGIELPD
jgi:hypothetical protein